MEYQLMFSNSTSDFNFSDEPITFGPFPIGKRTFVLKECSEATFTAYANSIKKALRRSTEDTKILYQDGGQEADTLLLQRCLFEVVGEKQIPTPLAYIEDLPRRISSKLYAKIREISGMDDEQETIEFLTSRIESDKKKLADLNEGKETVIKNG